MILKMGSILRNNQSIRQRYHFQIIFVEAGYRDVKMERIILAA
jgi:hypothetical protein